ncbi:DUF2145 domain-containing protein [Phenylobacterium sp.]|uniref:DUF2145 domain-containing protein n=1 Tax=Phenylobacterium sp. TaxID=1871053 RepID=UPI002F3FB0B7
MRLLTRLACAAAIAFAALPTSASAQDSSVRSVAAHFTAPEAATFSKQIEKDLAAHGAQVAMVFRTGRPRSDLPDGIAYTHGAFWIYRTITTADGRTLSGYAVYNLYAGDGHAWPKNQSRLVQDFPFDFTRGSAVDDVAVIIPSPEMQRRILAVVDSPTYQRLHNPAYSLVANPWDSKYQNCNNFMLDVVGAAAWDTTDAARITVDLKAHYQPTIVKAGPLMRMFGPIADSRLRTDDQNGPIRTATYESMSAFMEKNGLLEAAYTLSFARP